MTKKPSDGAPGVELERVQVVTSLLARTRAGLALTGKTMADFSRTLGVTDSHLWQVLRGKHESRRVTAAAEDFVARVETELQRLRDAGDAGGEQG